MKKRLFTFVIVVLSVTAALSQELRLVVQNKPLNTVLNTLNIEISFDDKSLSLYNVSVSQTFKTPEEAIRFLLKDKPFKVEKVGSVYVISTKPAIEIEKRQAVRRTYTLSGELSDRLTGEPLPYAYIQTDKGVISTNESGYFSIVRDTNSPVRIQTQYMGFEPLDTTLHVGNHKLLLLPKIVSLDEVIISQPSPSAMLMQSGKTSGEIRLNHQIAQYMPGSADNSIFSLLRMMPGVRASGEPSEDLIVWGSNWGESRLTYDGFTIFGMKSFNDQISSVNPYLVKDIRLSKGGFGTSEGDRIGAIAQITGNEGSFDRPSVKANLSNYTANIYASFPIKRSAAFSVAYRQTFYNLYNDSSINSSKESGLGDGNNNGNDNQTSPDIYIKPAYDFRDLNVKFTGKAFENDRYYISLYGADDHFKFGVKQRDYELDATEKNKQCGAAANYNRVWASGSSSKLLVSYSRLSAAIDNVSGITQSTSLDLFNIKNTVQELSLKLEHSFNVGQYQKLQIGGQWQHYTTEYNNKERGVNNPTLYITDNISVGKFSLTAGLRADLLPNNRLYVQPRLSARYSFTEELTATASFGLYNQFLTRVPYQYREGSYQMIWNLSDSTYLSSAHSLAGVAYSKNGWLISMEGYFKRNKNLLYFIDNQVKSFDNINTGVDFLVKKEWKESVIWSSYSLVRSTQPQESTGHEIKTGVVYSLKPLYLSATYIYGIGFPYLSTGGHGHGKGDEEQEHGNEYQHSDISSEPYNRLDLSLVYQLEMKRIKMKTGVSVLNLFNTNNVRYSYRLSDQDNVFNIYAKATPLTPIAFFEIIF